MSTFLTMCRTSFILTPLGGSLLVVPVGRLTEKPPTGATMQGQTDSPSGARDLFDVHTATLSDSVRNILRDLDVGRAEGEIKLRVAQVERNVQGLEESQLVSQDLLDSVISL